MSRTKQWRGLKALVESAVEHGSLAIEKVQKETANRPFGILEQIPEIAAPAKGVHVVHDAVVSGVHGMIRVVNRAVGTSLDAVLDVVDRADEEREGKGGAPR